MSGLTPQQLLARIGRFTGSTFAGLLGRSPYAPPLDWWKWQMGLEKPKVSLPMELGSIYEDAIVGASQLLLTRGKGPHDQKVGSDYERFEKPGSTFHAEHKQWLVVHPDGVFWSAKEMLQAKRHDGFLRSKYGRPGEQGESDNDIVPVHELIQCQIELACWSSNRGDEARVWRVIWLACDFGEAGGPRLYRIVKNPALISTLLEAGHNFWLKHMQPGHHRPPSNAGWQAWMDSSQKDPTRSTTAPNYRVPLTREDINASPIVSFP